MPSGSQRVSGNCSELLRTHLICLLIYVFAYVFICLFLCLFVYSFIIFFTIVQYIRISQVFFSSSTVINFKNDDIELHGQKSSWSLYECDYPDLHREGKSLIEQYFTFQER